MLITFQRVFLDFKDSYYGKEFTIMNFIFGFCKNYLLKKKTIKYHWSNLFRLN